MLFNNKSQGDERVFLTVKCVEASSITLGMGVALRIGGAASFDGIQAVMARSGSSADLPGFLGVAVQNIPSNAFGLVQIYGNCGSVLISNDVSSVTIATGNPLTPGALSGGFHSGSGTPSFSNGGFGYVICSNAPSNTISQAAPLYASGFIRAWH